MSNHQQPAPDVLPGWPTEPPYVPARRSDSPAAWARDQAEAARYAQPQQPTIINNYYSAPARRGPDVRQVLGWTAVGGIVTATLLAVATVAVALGLAALALAIMALVIRQLWRDLKSGK